MYMNINNIRADYQQQKLTPKQLCQQIRERSLQFAEYNIWIHLLSAEQQQPYLDALAEKDPQTCPLWGIPFAIKDNIDLAGIPTTAACDEFAYIPDQSAFVVQQLLNAGAIPVGKTNLDQFATGLNGTRSPYGACHNAFDFDYISGGSSSGSAVAVALGLVCFSLGTDTAGSGRVPACFNNLVGLKPTRGILSNSGVVPACKSLDCISIFAQTIDDANTLLAVAEGFDEQDGYSRKNPFGNQYRQYGVRSCPLKMGILAAEQLQFFGDHGYATAYRQTLNKLSGLDIEFVEIDYQPFDETARLLYEGPWVAERYLACLPLIEQQPQAINSVILGIIAQGKAPHATDLFRAQYRLQTLKQRCLAQLQQCDCLLLPTAGKCFTQDELKREPVLCNSQLGYYTNFVNLLDLAALAIPTAFTENQLPFGVTLIAEAFTDRCLLSIAKRIEMTLQLPLGVEKQPADGVLCGTERAGKDNQWIDVSVCGAHLQDCVLNWQLTERGAKRIVQTYTAAKYRMYLLENEAVLRPGLILDNDAGCAIEIEIWSLPAAQFGSFVSEITAPLGIGKLETIDGQQVNGFICEPHALAKSREITNFGSWRQFLAQR